MPIRLRFEPFRVTIKRHTGSKGESPDQSMIKDPTVPMDSELSAGTLCTDASVFSPRHAPDVAPILSQTTSILRFNSGDRTADIPLDRYVCLMRNAHFRPSDRGLLSEDKKSIIVPLMLPIPPKIDDGLFGDRFQILEKNKVRTCYPDPSIRIEGEAFCPYSTGGWAVFVLDTVIGAYRAHRMLGSRPRMLLPTGLSPRLREFLALAGVDAEHIIEIPRERVAIVEQAILASRSFAIDVEARIEGGKRYLGALVEPTDICCFNEMILSRFSGGPKRRIYISRRDVVVRQIENEQAVSDALASRGFETLPLATMSVHDIVTAFANAEIVVGPIGSGTVNVIFSPPGIPVIEHDHPHNDFVTHGICRALGHKIGLVGRVPTAERKRGTRHSITINVDALCQKVDEALD
jgi:hypothetical protein